MARSRTITIGVVIATAVIAPILIANYNPVLGAVPIEKFFPFGASAGDSVIPTGDDGFVGPIEFTYPFVFYDATYTSGYVNINGAVSFLDGVDTYTPDCQSNTSSSVGMIAPFWADVYTANGGTISYRQTSDPALLKKFQMEYNLVLYWVTYLPPPKWLFIVTWFQVGFYNVGCPNDAGKNTFQLVMASDGVSSSYMVNFNSITWTTGTASGGNCSGLGGVPAKVGFELDGEFNGVGGSCTDDVVNIEDYLTREMNEPDYGKFIWTIDNTYKVLGTCNNDVNVRANQIPVFVDGYGHQPLAIQGPCFDDVTSARCIFKDGRDINGVSVPALIIPTAYYFGFPNAINFTICEVPYLYAVPYEGIMRVEFVLSSSTGQNTTYFTETYVNAPDGLVTGSITSDANNAAISVSWNTNGFQSETVPTLNVILLQYEYSINAWSETTTIATNIANNGAYSQQVALSTFGSTTTSFYAIRLKPSDQVPFRRKKRDINLMVGDQYKNSGYVKASQFTPPTCVYNPALDYESICDTWFASDPGAPSDLLTCPPTLAQAKQDVNFEAERADQVAYLYPGASSVYRQRVPSASRGGISCGYNSNGQMQLGTGRSARSSPAYDFLAHWRDDVVPWCNCCKFPTVNQAGSCGKYFQKRPFDMGYGYRPPAVASGNGDPHIRTLDGLSYTFNGVGEYYCIKSTAGGFQMQCRLEQWTSMVDGATASASVFTAAVFSDGVSEYQVSISFVGELQILVDGELVPFGFDEGDKPRTIRKSTSSITKDGTDIIVAFFKGYTIKMAVNLNSLTFTSFVSPQNSGNVNGLFGHFDDNQANDLTAANGNVVPANSNLQTIHNDFGLTWLVVASDSLFTYPRGQSYNTFNNPGFQPSFTLPNTDNLPPQVVAAACQNSTDCLYDFATTGDLAFATNSGTQQREFESTATVLSPANNPCVCPNPPTSISNGFVINNATNYNIGSRVYFGCYQPYKCICGSNKKSIQCVSKPGNTCAWESPVPRCQRPLPLVGCLASLGCLLCDILHIL